MVNKLDDGGESQPLLATSNSGARQGNGSTGIFINVPLRLFNGRVFF